MYPLNASVPVNESLYQLFSSGPVKLGETSSYKLGDLTHEESIDRVSPAESVQLTTIVMCLRRVHRDSFLVCIALKLVG